MQMTPPTDHHSYFLVLDGSGSVDAGCDDDTVALESAEAAVKQRGGRAVIYRATHTVEMVKGKLVTTPLA